MTPVILIVGLGNPGKQYKNTPHNIGFRALDFFKNTYFSNSSWKRALESAIVENEICGKQIILQKPLTYMNNSGRAVFQLITIRNIDISKNLWVLHDDIDFPLGKVKIDFGRSSAGHKGVKSIIDALGTNEFWRFRIGVKPDTPFQSKEDIDCYLTNNPLFYPQKTFYKLIQEKTSALAADALTNGIKKHLLSLSREIEDLP